jgi:hypothetical protein
LGCEFGQFALRLDPGIQWDNQRHTQRFCTVQQLYGNGYRHEFASAVGVERVVDYDYVEYFNFVDYYYVSALWYRRKRVFECVERLRRDIALQLGCEFGQFALRLDPGIQRDNQRHTQQFRAV